MAPLEPSVSPERSRLMAGIRTKNTKPEVQIRRLLHSLGYRFRLHRRDLPGVPDIVFPSRQKIIFVHGCFWHQHTNCRKATIPKTRTAFWRQKLSGNVARDARATQELRRMDWKVLVVWECEVRAADALTRKVRSFLESR